MGQLQLAECAANTRHREDADLVATEVRAQARESAMACELAAKRSNTIEVNSYTTHVCKYIGSNYLQL